MVNRQMRDHHGKTTTAVVMESICRVEKTLDVPHPHGVISSDNHEGCLREHPLHKEEWITGQRGKPENQIIDPVNSTDKAATVGGDMDKVANLVKTASNMDREDEMGKIDGNNRSHVEVLIIDRRGKPSSKCKHLLPRQLRSLRQTRCLPFLPLKHVSPGAHHHNSHL